MGSMAKASKKKTTAKKKAAAKKTTAKKQPAKRKSTAKAKASPKAAPARKASPTEAQIRERAKQIWLERGRPAGRDEENWLEAERQLREEG